jgi:hypothetical protein
MTVTDINRRSGEVLMSNDTVNNFAKVYPANLEGGGWPVPVRGRANDQRGLLPVHPLLGLVTLTFRSLNSFMRPFAQMPRGFCRRAMSGDGADCRSH